MNILTVNLLFSTLVFWVAARIYVFPKLAVLKPQTLLLPILLLHALSMRFALGSTSKRGQQKSGLVSKFDNF